MGAQPPETQQPPMHTPAAHLQPSASTPSRPPRFHIWLTGGVRPLQSLVHSFLPDRNTKSSRRSALSASGPQIDSQARQLLLQACHWLRICPKITFNFSLIFLYCLLSALNNCCEGGAGWRNAKNCSLGL